MELKPVYQIQKPSNAAVNIQEDKTKDEWVINRDSSANGFRLPSLEEWRAAASYGQERLDSLPYTTETGTGSAYSDVIDSAFINLIFQLS